MKTRETVKNVVEEGLENMIEMPKLLEILLSPIKKKPLKLNNDAKVDWYWQML